ncbi:hypothetical protein GCM10009642_24070 [Nocardiopsis metallicus]
MALRDLVAERAAESPHVAAARLWGALECLRKAGGTGRSLTLDEVGGHGWVVLSSGDARIATWSTTLNGNPDPAMFAVLTGEER